MISTQLRIGLVGGAASYHGRAFACIINGFEDAKVPEKWPIHKKRIRDARIVAVWDEDVEAAHSLAKVYSISRVVDRMEDTLKDVDAIIIPDDMTMTHQKRAPFFLRERVPTFIDKPLSNNVEEASQIVELARKKGTLLMSSSALRYAREIEVVRKKLKTLGRIEIATTICQGHLIHYGIHPLELSYSVLGPGIKWVQNTGLPDRNIVKITYKDGRILMLMVFQSIAYLFQLNLYGENSWQEVVVEDADYFYWNLLRHFTIMIKENKEPIPLEETLEIIKVLTSAERSLQNRGKKISIH